MLKKFSFVQGLVWSIILFVIPLPLIQSLATGLPSMYNSEAFAIQIGSIAYVWFLAAIYLSTRPKWIDRIIGLPSIYFIHGMLSIFAIILAYLHKDQTTSYGLIKQTGDWAFDVFIALMTYSLVFMAGWLTSRIQFLNIMKRWLEHLFHHELSVWLHRLNLVAVVLVFIHVQLISYITSISAYIWLFNGYTLIVAVLYGYAKINNYYLLSKGKLIAKTALNDNFYEFTIQLRHPSRIHIKPGDFVFIKFPNHDQLKELHPFSVVNSVGSDGLIILAIRGDGDFTKKIQQLDVGANVEVEGSYGKFAEIISDHPTMNLTLIAGGSGIAPMISIINANPGKMITLFYSAHNAEDLVYADQLQKLSTQRPTLTVHIQQGRYDIQSEINSIPPAETLFLLSGPNAMGRSWKQAIFNSGVPADRIYFEEFSW